MNVCIHLDTKLCSAPVTTLSVVLDLVVGLHAEPVRDGAVEEVRIDAKGLKEEGRSQL